MAQWHKNGTNKHSWCSLDDEGGAHGHMDTFGRHVCMSMHFSLENKAACSGARQAWQLPIVNGHASLLQVELQRLAGSGHVACWQ